MTEKLVLAYSGGLDTSVAVRWLAERGYDVIALTAGVGIDVDAATLEERAKGAGAVDFRLMDARQDFIRYFAFPALAAGALYQGRYPLATALARPLIVRLRSGKNPLSGRVPRANSAMTAPEAAISAASSKCAAG